MNRLILAAAFLMLPAGAVAQAPIAADASANPGAAVLAVAVPVVSGDAPDLARQSRLSLSQAPVAPAQRNRAVPRRRGSMVGYIDDAVVESKVRLRYDFGSDMNAPDRAEFFYAKCGCYRNPAAGVNFDPAAPGPGPAAVGSLDFRQVYAQGEVGLTDRFSLFADLPRRWIRPKTFLPGTGSPFSSAPIMARPKDFNACRRAFHTPSSSSS